MGELALGMNLAFLRPLDKSVEWGIAAAADIGYRYVQPLLPNGPTRLGHPQATQALDDPLELRETCEKYGVTLSGLTANAPLAKPEVSVPYLMDAVRFAAVAGAPTVVTVDATPIRGTREHEAHTLIRYVLHETAALAEHRRVRLSIGTRGGYSHTPDLLRKVMLLSASGAIGVDFDTAGAFLSGNDPAHWLREIVDDVIGINVKEIAEATVSSYNMTDQVHPVACGDGLLDWERIINVARTAPRDLVLSVEPTTLGDAAKSFEHLQGILADTGVAA